MTFLYHVAVPTDAIQSFQETIIKLSHRYSACLPKPVPRATVWYHRFAEGVKLVVAIHRNHRKFCMQSKPVILTVSKDCCCLSRVQTLGITVFKIVVWEVNRMFYDHIFHFISTLLHVKMMTCLLNWQILIHLFPFLAHIYLSMT